MDKNQLKIQALLEKISALVTQYESTMADYRVEITLLTARVEELSAALSEGNRDQKAEDPASRSE